MKAPTRAEYEHVRKLIASLRSTTCPACGGFKQPNQTMCRRDYSKLSGPQKRALYKRVGEGYEAAVADALKTLGVTEMKEGA